MPYRTRLRLTILSGIVATLVGCVAVQPAPPTPTHHPEVATATTTATPQVATHLPTNTPAPTSTSVPTPTMTPTVPLSTEGPWLISSASPKDNWLVSHLFAVNPDGTGPVQLSNSDEFVHLFAVSSLIDVTGQAHIAYIASSSLGAGELTLSLLTLPGGQKEVITLTSPETTYTDQDPNDEDSNYDTVTAIFHAITLEDSLQWSPDGQWLAFVGAMDGISTDVYSYELATGRVRRLSSESDNAFQLLWSPDSRWILYTAKGLWGHCGGLYEPVSGVWASRPDGAQVIQLEGAKATKFLGWVTEDTVAAYRGGGYLSERGLRTVNITSGAIDQLGPSCFGDVVYSNEHRIFLVSVTEFDVIFCDLPPEWVPGLYLVSDVSNRRVADQPTFGTANKLPIIDPKTEEAVEVPVWSYSLQWASEWDAFVVNGPRGRPEYLILPDGQIVEEIPASDPNPSVAISEDGLFRAWWSAGGLYTASAPDYLPHPVPDTDVLSGNNLTWTP